ncbi:MAG: hypothetical protein HZC02_04250 [Candidatus Levybacteria bacterium]|nr:hypothetical protein [Candidatus Levybacteria bacterium]
METLWKILSIMRLVGKPIELGFKCPYPHAYTVYPPAGMSDYDINRAKKQAANSPCRACAPQMWASDELTGAYSELHRAMKYFYFWATLAENLANTFGMRKK